MRRLIPTLIAALVLGGMLPGVVGARTPQTEHDRILAYWTPERIANAKPKDYVMTASGKLVPYARPGGSGGSTGSTGSSWTLNGAIETRSGRVLFHQGTGDWICSASVVNDNGNAGDTYSIVVTAGHCAYDGTDGWASNWMYIPDFDDAPTYSCASTVYGCWTARSLTISSGFYPGGFGNNTVTSDWAFAVVGPGGKSGTAQLDALGSYGLATSGNTVGTSVWAFGYPAAGKYHGKDLVYCNGSTVADPYGAATWGVACGMTGGSSGGPWLVGTLTASQIAGGSGSVGSVNSYGYSGLKYMFGPRFNANTQTTFNAANALTPDAIGTDYYVDSTKH
jgi:V8-like Glu-specific endopeptidase